MKKLACYFVFSIATIFGASAQSAAPSFPEWEAKPQLHPLPPEYNNEHAVVLVEDMTINYVYEAWELHMYRTIHRIVKVLDRTGIESFNTVEIPLNTLLDSVKARTILPDGTTRDINSEMMHVTRGANGGLKLIFAMEAVDKNAEIEVLIHDMSYTSVFGSYAFQQPIPVLNATFRMNYPKDAAFAVKGYHGCPTAKEETYGNKKHITIYQANLPALEPEKFTNYDKYRMRVDYRLQHWINRNNQPGTELDWNHFAENIYNSNYNITDKEKKAGMRFLTLIGIKGDETEAVKIKRIEEGVKTRIGRSEFMDDAMGSNLDTVLDRRSANSEGILRLMATCFVLTGVNHELGYTSDRTENALDVQFPNYALLDYPVFYFPNQKSYLAPLSQYTRYPEVPFYFTGNKGIFCATNPANGYTFGNKDRVGEAKVRQIPASQPEKNTSDIATTITISENNNPTAEVKYTYTGYKAVNMRTILANATQDKTKDIVFNQVGLARRKDNILNSNFINASFKDAAKPFVLTAAVIAPQLVEKAGNKLVFKIGDVIGKQTDLYDNKPRVLPVDFNYPEIKKHTITVVLPAGVKIDNLESLNRYAEHTDLDDGHITASFRSAYTLTNNILTVTITETYTKLHYPVREYQSIRKVINAVADFNQVALLLDMGKVKAPKKKASQPVSIKK